MSRHLMILPSLDCPSRCAYCFGPRAGGQLMALATVEAIARWQKSLGGTERVDVTFHGGEPLLAGAGFFREALPLLHDGPTLRRTRFSVQSNLWRLDDEICEILREHDVAIGTSLDGPEAINDAQRGAGYFRRAMAGVESARASGLRVGCISTFTPLSALRADEVHEFFQREGLSFSVHAAVPALGAAESRLALPPDDHGDLLVRLLDRYLAAPSGVRIGTLDSMARSVSAGRGGICTFGDCLGEYLAVDPEGWIYPCQRLAGLADYRLGHVRDCPSVAALAQAPAWRAFERRQKRIGEECGDCEHFAYCRGGCPYNALTASRSEGAILGRDPHCPAYRRAFGKIVERALGDVFSAENLTAVASAGPEDRGLLQKGALVEIMRDAPRPRDLADRARRIAAAAALGASASPEEAVARLDRVGLVSRREVALGSVTALRDDLRRQSGALANAYVHVTYDCDLRCDHCYASAGPKRSRAAMSVDEVTRLVSAAAAAGFAKVVLTGGEPLVHPERDRLLEALAALRQTAKPTLVVLRTNLAGVLPPRQLGQLGRGADQIVVSLDGDEATHDARRGAGAYRRTVANLRALLGTHPAAEVSLAATLSGAAARGPAGASVRVLAGDLGLAVRFKPVLPLGRAGATSLRLQPEPYSSIEDADDTSEDVSAGCVERAGAMLLGARPASTCGLGMNVYVAPDGECYPCHALVGPRHSLGNALALRLAGVLGSDRFRALRSVTVDSNRGCRSCYLRYLCGGFCRAWGEPADPDAPARDCEAQRDWARRLLASALAALGVDESRWRAAGLP